MQAAEARREATAGEALRAGIASLPRGQREAGLAIEVMHPVTLLEKQLKTVYCDKKRIIFIC